MPDVVTIERVRTHVRLNADDASEDEYLKPLLAAALRSIEHQTGQRFIGGAETLPAADMSLVAHAALLLVGPWYANRESVVIGATAADLPQTVDMLLAPLRTWVR